MGLTNAVATIPGIIGPYIAKAIAHKVSNYKGACPNSLWKNHHYDVGGGGGGGGGREGILVHDNVNFSTRTLDKAPKLDNDYVSLSLSPYTFSYTHIYTPLSP